MLTAARATVVLVALAALAAIPATASAAAHRHNLKLYKVERQVSMSTPDAYADASCDSGDYALDAMSRVDSVDNNALTGIRVAEMRGDAADPATYHFHFTKSVPGQAQLKVFLTCLGGTTAPDGHQHAWTISSQRTADFGPSGPGVGYGWQPSGQACAVGEIAVAPGFVFTSGSGRVVGSRAPLSSEFDPHRNWSFAFYLDAPSTWTTSMRCLSLTSTVASGHAHKIQVTYIENQHDTIAPGETKEVRVNCSDQSKGMIAGVDTDGASAPYDWFLGMDPRIKQRAFRFFNSGPAPIDVYTGLTCFNDRTTKAG